MKHQGINLRTILLISLSLGIVSVLGLFIHELGHGLTAEVLGGKFKALYVLPGIQIWPNPGRLYPGVWSGYFGLAQYAYGPDWKPDSWQVGAVEFMGSGSTLFAAILALGALFLFHPLGWPRLLLLTCVLMFADLLFYTFLPLIGLRHWIVFGGNVPEPLEGALKLGISQWSFLLFVILVSALMIWGVVKAVRMQSST